MRKLMKRLLVGAFLLVNATVAAGTARAEEGKQDLNVDNFGGLIIVWCDGCWFWNCNCPTSVPS